MKPLDSPSGRPVEKDLEAKVSGNAGGNANPEIQTSYFYSAPNVARVDVSMDFPPSAVEFTKVKGKVHSVVSILGIAYKADGSVAARFSDELKLNLDDKKDVERIKKRPLPYGTQFEIAAGTYTLKVVFSSGGPSFGKVERLLTIDANDGKQFRLSGIALGKDAHQLSDLDTERDSAFLNGGKPLVYQGLEITPAGSTHFHKAAPFYLYVELYEPLLLAKATPQIGVGVRMLNRKTGAQTQDAGFLRLESNTTPGNPVVPVGLHLSLEPLPSGSYTIELKARDSGGSSFIRQANFDVE